MRVVILGGGYAGLTVTRRLERQLADDVELVLVDDTGTHLLKHELHRIVRHPELADVLTMPLETVVSRATVRNARVTDIDTHEEVVTLDTTTGAEQLEYDFAAVCLGSETAFYGIESIKQHATPLKEITDAQTIRERVRTSPGSDVVIGGAGFSGIQLAGELASLSAEESLDLAITLVERADRIAPMFVEPLARAIEDELDARDVAIETGVGVEHADETSVSLANGETLPADVFAWTGGIAGPQATDGDRRPVGADLRIDETTFAAGDVGEVTDQEGATAPASAQTAVRQARVVAENITRCIEAREREEPPELERYTVDVPGWVVSVGDGAVAHVGPVVISGEPARAVKAFIVGSHLTSVGATRRASMMVAEELGWPVPSCEDVSDDQPLSLPTDPASPSELQRLFAQLPLSVAKTYAPAEPLDLTAFTQATDRRYSGSPLNTIQRGIFDVIEAGLDGVSSVDDDDDEMHTIEVRSERDSDEDQTGDGDDTDQAGDEDTS